MKAIPASRTLALVVTVAWTSFLFYLGSVPEPPEGLSAARAIVSAPLAHYGTHLVLAALLYMVVGRRSSNLRHGMRAAAIAILVTVGAGIALEVVQLFLEERSSEISDVVYDALGATTGVTLLLALERLNVDRRFLSLATSGVAVAAMTGVAVATVVSDPGFPHVEDCGSFSGPLTTAATTSKSQTRPPQETSTTGRVADGLVVLYDFSEGSGILVHDKSGVEPAVDLTILDPTKTRWIPGSNGVEVVDQGGGMRSRTFPPKVYSALLATDRLTLEAWVIPRSLGQKGSTSIVALAEGGLRRKMNLRLTQTGSSANFGLRTVCDVFHTTDVPDVFADILNPRHLVATYDGTIQRMFVDGVRQETAEPLEGDLSNWDLGYPLIIGNDARDRPFLGKIFLVAIYDRVLASGEIRENFAAGPLTQPVGR